ncbi:MULTISPECIES: hypothetical protein [unclassified Campylobacter]|uniref:hypothetical protein n=1 Tax=unclassified Campylobacter TaxID=2593542 RepID=UPI0022E9AEDC|nr:MULTISPECIES: hypothetical protein [unclassified Campylobacter]MDA3056436.1 hypothetical protein [Campylobacter sp. CN_NA1]MDA3069369.1 hypothetical protein [Campylobacter sp. CN_NE3]
MSCALQVSYTKPQQRIFWESAKRFRIIAKGRRFGLTRGFANYAVENLLDGKNILWVDTINANIQRYFERYFMPVLKQLPSEIWKWSKQDKKLTFSNGAFLDMRSADRPENIEGFAYDIALLNEAGIILKNAYLWENAIRPMLLDNPNSIAIIGGVPKGKNKFYELVQKALKGGEWEFLQYSSFDNPLIDKNEILGLIDEMGGENSPVVKQEIYGEFVDNATNLILSISELEHAFNKPNLEADINAVEVWACDIARFGDDFSVLAKRSGNNVYSFAKFSGLATTQTAEKIFSEYIRSEKKPQRIFIDSTGVGAGVFDILHDKGLPVSEAMMSAKAINEIYVNKRAEMYFNLKEKMPFLKIANEQNLITEAMASEYFYNAKNQIQIESKDEIKRKIGRSPDSLDSLAMLFYEPVLSENLQRRDDDWSGYGW